MPEEDAGELLLWSGGVLLDVVEDEEVVGESRGLAFELGDGGGVGAEIGFALAGEGFAGFADFVVVVDDFDRLLEADGDEQANDDGGDVEEEVGPGVGGLVGWMDVEHKTECRA